jgi:hypothetical protein
MAQIRCDVPRLVIEQWRKPQMVAVAHSQPPEPSGPHVPQLHFGSGVSGTTGTTVQAGSWTGELPPIGMLLNASHSVELGHRMEQVAKVSLRLAPPNLLSPRNSHPPLPARPPSVVDSRRRRVGVIPGCVLLPSRTPVGQRGRDGR